MLDGRKSVKTSTYLPSGMNVPRKSVVLRPHDVGGAVGLVGWYPRSARPVDTRFVARLPSGSARRHDLKNATSAILLRIAQ